MKEKDLITTLKLLLKKNRKDYGPSCETFVIGCPACEHSILRAYLEYWLENLEWDGGVKK